MPQKLDDCVKAIKKQQLKIGKSEKEASDSAYAICSKATGWVHTTGGKWKQRISKESKELSENNQGFKKGIYVEAKLDPIATQKLLNFIKEAGLKNITPANNIHVTIIYSTRAPNGPFKLTPINGFVEPDHFEIFGGKKGNPYVLVLVVRSNELLRKHKYYMKEYNLKFDYPEYKSHITIAYDLNRLLPGINLNNPKAKTNLENLFNLLIPDLPKQIKLQYESVEELDPSWLEESSLVALLQSMKIY